MKSKIYHKKKTTKGYEKRKSNAREDEVVELVGVGGSKGTAVVDRVAIDTRAVRRDEDVTDVTARERAVPGTVIELRVLGDNKTRKRRRSRESPQERGKERKRTN